MNAQTKVLPFNPMTAYEHERVYSATLERHLSKALMLLSMECSRRELRGEDVAHIPRFIAEATA